jgi:hypothetical protein
LAALKALLEHGLSGAMIFDVNLTQAQPKIDKLQKGMFVRVLLVSTCLLAFF